jgi:hypothetical protein
VVLILTDVVELNVNEVTLSYIVIPEIKPSQEFAIYVLYNGQVVQSYDSQAGVLIRYSVSVVDVIDTSVTQKSSPLGFDTPTT